MNKSSKKISNEETQMKLQYYDKLIILPLHIKNANVFNWSVGKREGLLETFDNYNLTFKVISVNNSPNYKKIAEGQVQINDNENVVSIKYADGAFWFITEIHSKKRLPTRYALYGIYNNKQLKFFDTENELLFVQYTNLICEVQSDRDTFQLSALTNKGLSVVYIRPLLNRQIRKIIYMGDKVMALLTQTYIEVGNKYKYTNSLTIMNMTLPKEKSICSYSITQKYEPAADILKVVDDKHIIMYVNKPYGGFHYALISDGQNKPKDLLSVLDKSATYIETAYTTDKGIVLIENIPYSTDAESGNLKNKVELFIKQ